ncbi:MAG: epoxyqueuosine reductase QueH [Clostridiales bacterium]|nr:epoxyqueuosine reductase QueH [Clostridiales bacterium]
MKKNYSREMESVISSLDGKRPRLLLHSCCGPCSSSVLEYLTRHFDVTVFFFNPNIQPEEEYEKRLFWQRKVIDRYKGAVGLTAPLYEGGSFTEVSKGLETLPEGGQRCENCFLLRLSETAKLAKKERFDYFSTTLTVSPHKNAEMINKIGFELAEQNSINWLPADFKKKEGYKRSIELSAEYGLYRQTYCGCLCSQNNSRTLT